MMTYNCSTGITTYSDAESLSDDLGGKIRDNDQKAFQELQKFLNRELQPELLPRALYEMSEVYFNGYCGVERSRQKSFELLQQAADKEDIAAMKKLGKFYQDGKQGFKMDAKKALEYFIKIGDSGFPEGYELAAKLLKEKRGVIDNYGQKVIDLYQKLVDLENDDALLEIAEIYTEGFGEVLPDGQVALEIYNELIRGREYWVKVYKNFKIDSPYLHNYKKALTEVGRIYKEGRGGIQADGYKAIEFFTKAEYWDGIADIYQEGKGGVKADGYKAIEFFTKDEDWLLVGYIYMDGKAGVKADGYKAIEYFNKVKNWAGIAKIYQKGIGGVQQDAQKAVEYHTKDENWEALAEIYEEGLGDIEPDLEKAQEFRNKADYQFNSIFREVE